MREITRLSNRAGSRGGRALAQARFLLRESRRGRLAVGLRAAGTLPLCLLLSLPLRAQKLIELPPAPPISQAGALQSFRFVTDGPYGPGWSRPKELPRIYFHERLPDLFSRTLRIDQDLPRGAKLSWIFTGPHAGITVELYPDHLRVYQRYYDSPGLDGAALPHANYPEAVVRDNSIDYAGGVREMRVVLDRHLALEVWLNGKEILTQPCLFDVTRHQLALAAPRSERHVVTGALLDGPSTSATVTVFPRKMRQAMIGFGGSPSIPAYARMPERQQQRYWALLRRYNLRIDREYPMGSQLQPNLSNLEDLSQATPHYYGDNFPNGEVTSFAYNKRIQEAGGEVMYEMWALPSWAEKPYTAPGGKVYPHAANPEEYARALVTYCRLAVRHTGRPPAIVGLENEVRQPPEIARRLAVEVRAALDRAGFHSVKIQMADAPFLYQGAERARELRSAPEAWKAIDFAASHEYDFQHFLANPDRYDARMRDMKDAIGAKPFLATEIALNDPRYQEPSYRLAFTVAQLYHKNLTLLDASGLLYCWTLLDVEQPTFGSSRALLVPDRNLDNRPVPSSFELRVLGAYSRHILAGMRRVEAASSDPNLLVTAFDDGGGRATVILLNRSTSVEHVALRWPGKHWTEIERTSQFLPNQTGPAPGALTVDPGEIVALSTFSAATLEDKQ